MNWILNDNIYLNKENGRFYILFKNTVYQFNGDVIDLDDISIFKTTNKFITLEQLDINKYYEYIKDKIDKYWILKEWVFFKPWRLVKIACEWKLLTWIIYNIVMNKLNEDDDEIYKIEVLLENGSRYSVNKDYIHRNIQPLTGDIDIKTDSIIEVLWYYNLDKLDLKIKNFLK